MVKLRIALGSSLLDMRERCSGIHCYVDFMLSLIYPSNELGLQSRTRKFVVPHSRSQTRHQRLKKSPTFFSATSTSNQAASLAIGALVVLAGIVAQLIICARATKGLRYSTGFQHPFASDRPISPASGTLSNFGTFD
mmetsp:Transcript_37315/g.60675  ORF Transcript_37315/g.60675 Transcript_37315/m.60675 type:complete len:137 (+) Transcript_37315:1269-1679(+)